MRSPCIYRRTPSVPNRQADALKPADIQQLRVDLIATRAVSTVNHYLATFAGFLYWCEDNGYCKDLAKHCTRFTKSHKDPDPLSFEEYQTLIDKGRSEEQTSELQSLMRRSYAVLCLTHKTET